MKLKIKLVPTIIIIALCFGIGYLVGMMIAPKSAKLSGTVSDAPSSEIVVKLLNVNQYEILDTLKTNAEGKFSYKVDVKKAQPEFVYLFYKDKKIASLLLERGDKVSVETDTLGIATVYGSPESEKLAQVEQSFADFSAKFIALTEKLEASKPDSEEYKTTSKALASAYIAYYRDRLKYVLNNSHSLTVVPVMFQQISDNLPLFSQHTDALHFNNVCDSLETVYPDSRYVKSLRAEAKSRLNTMELNSRLQSAEQVNYLDVEMPDVNGVKRKLSDTEGKVVLLHFWTASQPAQKMFNLDVLKPVYEDYKSKGLEIYQVAIDVDKANWARTIKDQELEWINVCDGLGEASPVVVTYNLATLPVSFLISDGSLVDEKLTDEASLRKVLKKLL